MISTMEAIDSTSLAAAAHSASGLERRHLRLLMHRLHRTLIASRPRRVLLLVVLLWMVSTFDLAFTLLAHQIGGFHEVNPLARQLLSNPGGLVAFKTAAVLPASCVMLAFRRRFLTEVACWVLCGVYTGLAFIWMEYYSLLVV